MEDDLFQRTQNKMISRISKQWFSKIPNNLFQNETFLQIGFLVPKNRFLSSEKSVFEFRKIGFRVPKNRFLSSEKSVFEIRKTCF